MQPDTPALSDQFRALILFIRRNLRLIALSAVVTVLLALWYVFTVDPLYRSSALLMVERPGSSPAVEEAGGAADGMEMFIDGQVFIIESAHVLSEVIDRLDLLDDPEFQPSPPSLIGRIRGLFSDPPAPASGVDPAMQTALRALRSAVRVEREGDSSVVRISVTASNGRKAATIADEIGAVYIENRLRAQATRASQVADWLDNRVVEVQAQLAAAEDAVAAFRAENTMIVEQGGITLNEQQLLELNVELVQIRAAIAEKRAIYARAQDVRSQGGTALALPQFEESEIVVGLRTQLLELQRRENELVSQGGSEDRRLAPIRQQISNIESQLEAERDRIIDLIGTEVATLEAREQLLAAGVLEIGGRSGTEGQSLVELRELERLAESYRTLYERYLANAGVAREDASYQIGGTEIISAANIPQNPDFPPKKVILILSLMLGVGAGAAIAALRELREPGLMTLAQTEELLGLPVRAVLPLLPSGAKPSKVVEEDPTSSYAEAVNVARHSLLTRGAGLGQVVCVTSAAANEGKTAFSVSLAHSASRAGLRVLLIDADFRQRAVTRMYDMSSEPGLGEILTAGGDALEIDTGAEGGALEVISTGNARAASADLLGSPAFDYFLECARDAYDLVVLDGPPVANLADAAILAEASDRVAFIARWRTTPRDQIKAALRRLGVPEKIALVLNAADLEKVSLYGEYVAYDAPETARKATGGTPQPI